MINHNMVIPIISGVLVFFSPCALAALPLYLTHLVGYLSSSKSMHYFLLLGLLSGLTAGLTLFVMGLSCLMISFLSSFYHQVRLVLSVFLVVLGVLGLAGLHVLPIRISIGFTGTRSVWLSALLYGFVYAITASSCALPVLLMMIIYAASMESFSAMLFTVALFSLGMSLPLTIVAALIPAIGGWFAVIRKHIASHYQVLTSLLVLISGLLMLLQNL